MRRVRRDVGSRNRNAARAKRAEQFRALRSIFASGNQGHRERTVGGESAKGGDEWGELALRDKQPVDHSGDDASGNESARTRQRRPVHSAASVGEKRVHQQDADAAKECDERSDRKIDAARA